MIGIAAMIWVGGGIIVHGVGLAARPIGSARHGGLVEWVGGAGIAAWSGSRSAR